MIARDIVVIGDVMLDVVVKPGAAIAPTSDTPSTVRLSRGGAGANVAETLARAGHHVTYVGACGDDVAAKHFKVALGAIGVSLALETVGASTGVVVAVVDNDGQRAMMTDRGANTALGIAHVLQGLERPFDHLHVSGYTLLDPRTTDVGRGAIARAIAGGRTTSVDVSSVAPLIALTPSTFMRAALGVHTLFANEEEALALGESDDLSLAIHRLAHEFNEVVITRGREGAWVHANGIDHRVASQSDRILDTTGAGDAATGAYLAVRLRDGSIDEALAAAMAAAAVVVRGLGWRGQSPV